jgi:protein-S-isoprenylcysteine O-methyltransferase Ste14
MSFSSIGFTKSSNTNTSIAYQFRGLNMTEELVFIVVFLLMYAVFGVARIYYRRKAAKAKHELSDQPPKTKPIRSWAHTAISISILGMFIAYILYVLITPWFPWFPLPFPSFLRWGGVILGAIAIPLLIWTHRTLGRSYSHELEIQDQHQLINTGPYARIRHPMYTVFITFTLGTVLITANLFITIFGLLVCFLLYPISKQEEQMLITEFGDQYRDYMNRTGRFLPRIRQPTKPKEES